VSERERERERERESESDYNHWKCMPLMPDMVCGAYFVSK
jgi:hypothetical protein